MTAQPVITRFVDLYDVPALADGQTVVSEAGSLVAKTPYTTDSPVAIPAGETFSLSNGLLVHQVGLDAADIAVDTEVARIDEYGNLLLGPNVYVTDTEINIHGAGVTPDFLYQQQARRLFIRSLIIAELGDPPDLVLSRAGPNNTYPDNDGDGISGVLASDPLGSIRFQGAYTPNGGTPGVTLGGSFQGDSAQIYARASENNVYDGATYHQGGELYFATTPNGASVSVDRLIIKQNGDLWFAGGTLRFTGTVPQLFVDSATSASHAFMDLKISTDSQSRFVMRNSGKMEWGGGGASVGVDTNLYRDAADRLRTDDLLRATDLGVATKVKAGTPADGDWAAAPPDGTIVGDSTGVKIWIRLGGAWKSVVVA